MFNWKDLDIEDVAEIAEELWPAAQKSEDDRGNRPQTWQGWLARRWGLTRAEVREYLTGKKPLPEIYKADLMIFHQINFIPEKITMILKSLKAADLDEGFAGSSARDPETNIVWNIERRDGEFIISSLGAWDERRGMIYAQPVLDRDEVASINFVIRNAIEAHESEG